MSATSDWVGVLTRGVRSGVAQLQRAVVPASGPSATGTRSPGQLPAAIDLVTLPTPYVQPDRTTCGSASLVMARMINHPQYAQAVIDPPDAEHGADVPARFRADVLAMHELTNAFRDETGRIQLPWPKSLGTHPWAVARRMTGTAGPEAADGCGVTGTSYTVRVADPSRLDGHLTAVAAAIAAGHCVPVFVGDALSPRHIALAVDADADSFGVYDPSRGVRVEITRPDIVSAAMNLAGWHTFWLSVLPRAAGG